MRSERYLVAGSRPWNRRVFDESISTYPGEWKFIEHPDDLTYEAVKRYGPRSIFFLHWSWRVPRQIHETYACVVFHMTDVPYGRGGSPLQNLILRGHRKTKLSAIRMVDEMDAGPVYAKADLYLDGSAEEIYVRQSRLAAAMIRDIIREAPKPVPQKGEPIVFQRRRPSESRIPPLEDLDAFHDFIRMLDAEGYPNAYLEYNGFRYEFRRVVRYDGRLEADVTIKPVGGESA